MIVEGVTIDPKTLTREELAREMEGCARVPEHLLELNEARAEVERLKAKLDLARQAARHFKARFFDVGEEVERLRVALTDLLNYNTPEDQWHAEQRAREVLEKSDERETRETA